MPRALRESGWPAVIALCSCGVIAILVLGAEGKDLALAAWSGAAGVAVQARRSDDRDGDA